VTPVPATTPAQPPASRASGHAPHVLVVDDDFLSGLAMKNYLGRIGFRTSFATDGRQAIDLAGRDPIDALVTDFRMPNLNGAELVRHLRADTPDLAVVVLTGYAPDAEDALGTGAERLVIMDKPVDPTAVEKAVRGLLG